MFLDHPEEVVGHGDDFSLLLHEQFELLAQLWGNVRLDLGRSFGPVHEERALAPKGEGEDQQGEREEEESLLVRGDVKRRSL